MGSAKRLIAAWWSRRRDLASARHELRLADLKARQALAVARAKADIEWDITWAEPASRSWRDEALLVLWSLPVIGLFVPPLRPAAEAGFEYLARFHPDAPAVYLGGWAIILAASFGMRQAASLFMPGKIATLATALAGLPEDIPAEAVAKAEAVLNPTPDQGQTPQ